MDKCSSCGAEMVEGAKFCIICGATAQKEARDVVKEDQKAAVDRKEVCQTCKAPLREGASFCVSCGTPLKESDEVPPASEPEKKKKREVKKPWGKSKTKPEKPVQLTATKIEEINEEKQADIRTEIEAELPAAKKSGQNELKNVEGWVVTTGEEPARQIDALDILAYGDGTVAKISFKDTPENSNLIIHGKLKCLGCNKLSLFSLTANRGWGGSNDPAKCPCGREVEIGEYWSDADNAIYVWASTDAAGIGIEDYLLSLIISRVVEA